MKKLLSTICVYAIFQQTLFAADITTIDPLAPLPLAPSSELLPTPKFEPPYKNPLLASSLSTLLPGLGHVYLGDTATAGALLGTTSMGVSMAFATVYSDPELAGVSIATASNAWAYGIFAAYRDARMMNSGSFGYTYPMPKDSLTDLAYAPISWATMKKPEVWGGIMGFFTAAVGVSYLYHNMEDSASIGSAISPVAALPIGIGEEALFRGYLQSQLMEACHPAVSITISSLLFGAAHIGNARGMSKEYQKRYYTVSLPLITSIGAYCGWLTHKNHSLKESVALHTWYDFILFSIQAVANQSASTGQKGFTASFSF